MQRGSSVWLVGALLAMTMTAEAQRRRDAGAVDAEVDAGPGPVVMVDGALGSQSAVTRSTRRTRDREETEVALPVRRGQCYRVLGAAVGASQVSVEVRVRTAPVTRPAAMANSQGAVASVPFCATESGDLYRALVVAEGASWWHLALVEDPTARPDAGAPRTSITADAGAPVQITQHPIGGTTQDYVGAQLRALAASRPGRFAMTPAQRNILQTNQFVDVAVALPAGRCVEAAAAGVPSVADLELTLEDPHGNRVAQDGTRRSTESVRYCPSYAGRYTLRVRVRAGAGMVAIQTFIDP